MPELDTGNRRVLADHDDSQILITGAQDDSAGAESQPARGSMEASRHDISISISTRRKLEIRALLERTSAASGRDGENEQEEDLLGVVTSSICCNNRCAAEPSRLIGLIRQPLVSETLPLLPALEQFRNARTHLPLLS